MRLLKEGNLERVKFLISKGAKVKARDKYGYTPLHWAAGGGQTETAKILISREPWSMLKVAETTHLYTVQQPTATPRP